MKTPSGHRVVSIDEGPRPDAHQAIVALHGAYYSQAWGFGAFFEQKVASELSAFMARYDRAHDRMYLAADRDRVVGSLIVDGGEADALLNGAHLRWFIVDDSCRGLGVGKRLMSAAQSFIQTAGFARCYLTTFAGLDSARALYERAGFTMVSQVPSETWGTPVIEQRYEWGPLTIAGSPPQASP